MVSIVIELTNRCNLSCQHCLDDRHNADGGNLKIDVIEKILRNDRDLDLGLFSFTGGEPSLHPHFIEIIAMVCKAGYDFGFVSNGWNFTEIHEKVLPYHKRLKCITFSLDGAREETHDRIRGKGSYRRVMQAISICVVKDIPFTVNTVITSCNRGELEEMAVLVEKLGSRGLRFGHLMLTPLIIANGLGLSPDERKETTATILQLRKSVQMPIVMAPGYYTTDLFPCDPLQMREINVDWQGNVTMCCHLSGYRNGAENRDVIDNLSETDFYEAYEQLVNLNKRFHQDKHERYNKGGFKDSDYFPCWYCLNYFNKLDWLKEYCEYPWFSDIWTN